MHGPRFKILIMAILAEGAVLILALFMAGNMEVTLFPLSDNMPRDIMIGTVGAIVPFMLFLITLSRKARNVPLLGSLRKTMVFDLRRIFSCTHLSDLVLISLLAGFAEEMLFRGILQTKYGIAAASILFGLIHCVSPAYVVATTIMGFYIGALFLMTGNLLVPVQLHFMYDLAALVYLRYFLKEE